MIFYFWSADKSDFTEHREMSREEAEERNGQLIMDSGRGSYHDKWHSSPDECNSFAAWRLREYKKNLGA